MFFVLVFLLFLSSSLATLMQVAAQVYGFAHVFSGDVPRNGVAGRFYDLDNSCLYDVQRHFRKAGISC